MKVTDRAKLFFGLGIVFVGVAVLECFDPTKSRPEGRYSWITGPIFDNFGSGGLIVYWFAVAFLLAIIAVINIRRDE